jgi:hypothetical protein
MARFSPVMAEDALTEARRFIRFRYFAFLASVLVVFVFTVIVGVAFIEALLSDEEWERLGINGGVVAVSTALLVLLLYRPGGSLALAASQMAQLEATRAHLNKSYEFWERYLVERQDDHQLTANDVALAVSSLTAASRDMTEGLAGEAADSKPMPRNGTRSGRPPTETLPDPRRY